MVTLLVKEAKNIREKITGLIGKEKSVSLMIRTRFGIHTFGLKFPIDVLILDKYSKVVAIKRSLKRNRIFVWNPIYDRVLELPEGTIDKENEAPRSRAARYQSGIPPKPTPHFAKVSLGVPLAPSSSKQASRFSAKGNKN